jgi:hypothetical protein
MKSKKIFRYIIFPVLILTTILFFKTGLTASTFSENEYYTSRDSSGFGCNGPIIIYSDGKILNYSVIQNGNSYIISKKNISKKDSLFCEVEETNQRFGFTLKDTIITEEDVCGLPMKMLVISDIHGNFKGFQMILRGAGVVDEKLNWIFGDGHLVIVGDIFDRGLNVTECLWLIYKLESEAKKAGGKVHFILGNHELMNLKGNYKYALRKYFIVADSIKLDYKNWYDNNTELGRWLRSKNSIEKTGDLLFVHGGISRIFSDAGYSMSDINEGIRSRIDKTYEKGEITNDVFIGKDGPLWYRGIVNSEEKQEDLEQTLACYNASKIILGHTIVDAIKFLYGQKAIAVNIDHQENTDNDRMFALLFEDNNFFVVDNNGNKTMLK